MTSTDPNQPAAAKPKTEPAGTRYIVLEERDGNGWADVGAVYARSATEAIRAAIVNYTTTADRYVAIPARSWQPVRVKVETVQRIKLEDA